MIKEYLKNRREKGENGKVHMDLLKRKKRQACTESIKKRKPDLYTNKERKERR